jgi:hypothetical protein
VKVAPLSEPDAFDDIAIIFSPSRPPLAAQWDGMQRVRTETASRVDKGRWPDATVAAPNARPATSPSAA